MEKNATATEVSIVKAEPPASAAVITVDVDPAALNCPKCLHPLTLPSVPENYLSSNLPANSIRVQCTAGHVVCSGCHGDLPAKDKCASCFINTGYTRCYIPTAYTRCLALEGVLRALRVACPRRCAAKMMYHEKAQHTTRCSVDDLQIGPVVRRMGPCGGAGGDATEMLISDVSRVVSVIVWHWDAVDAIGVTYERKCEELMQEGRWGGKGGRASTFRLEPDEHLTSVEGHYGAFNGPVIVRSLKFVSNLRAYGPYGKEDGVPFTLPAGVGGKIIGFHARCGQFIDAIGTYIQMK